jgi:copper(I)-binding protein
VRKIFATVAVGALALVACGSDDATTAPVATPVAGGTVAVSGAWVRNSPMAASVGAAYMVITSPVDDELIGVSVPAAIAARTEIHETVMVQPDQGSDTENATHSDDTMADGGHGSDTTHGGSHGSMGGGMMTMREIGAIALPAGKMVLLQPGGLHVMLLELAAPLELGATFTAVLEFAVSDPIEVTFEVRDTAP